MLAGRRGASVGRLGAPPEGRRGGFRDGRDGGDFLPSGLDGLTGGVGFLVGGLGLGGRRPGGRGPRALNAGVARGPILELKGLLLIVGAPCFDVRPDMNHSAVKDVLCLALSTLPTESVFGEFSTGVRLLFIPDVHAALSSRFFQ